MSYAADLTLHKESLELEKIDFDAAFAAWDDHDRWAPPQPDAKDVVAYADWIVELRLFSAIYDQDLEEEGHIVYFP